MPLRNRVTPRSELIAHPARGLVYGNRGCLHDDQGRIRRGYNGKRWISCRLEFRGWHREPLVQPGKFTELFFLDEATAFAAGHRPCALCRREDYVRFGELWRALHPGQSGADTIDEELHRERVGEDRAQRVHEIASEDLPEGVFVLHEGEPWLVLRSAIRRWTAAGYAERRRRPQGRMLAITPPSLIEVLRAGWNGAVPLLHPSALRNLREATRLPPARLAKYTQSVRFVTVVIATLACAAAPAFAGGDIYKPEKYVARYCSPSRDICVGIFRSSTIVFQLMTVERYFARYTICVRSPRGAKTCRTLPVNRQGSVWGSHKRWPRHFGDDRPGVYLVTWSQAGHRLGPTLRFAHR